MIQLLESAINQVKNLPDSEQEKIAILIIKELNQDSKQDEDEFEKIIENCQIKTGIKDLSYQHHHYLYGTAKQELVSSTLI